MNKAQAEAITRQVTEEAIAQVDEHMEPQWREQALAALSVLIRRGKEFTPDDIWVLLDKWEVPKPHAPSAMGPIIRAIGDRAYFTGYVSRSIFPTNHREVRHYQPYV